jgi:hypothetical protein
LDGRDPGVAYAKAALLSQSLLTTTSVCDREQAQRFLLDEAQQLLWTAPQTRKALAGWPLKYP